MAERSIASACRAESCNGTPVVRIHLLAQMQLWRNWQTPLCIDIQLYKLDTIS